MIDLKGFRKDKKLSQEDLADILNVKQSFISQVGMGVCPLPEAKITILEEKYGDVIKKYDNPNLLIDNNNQTTYNRSDTKQQIISVVEKIKAATCTTNKDLAVIMGAYPTVISDMKAGKTTARPEWLHKLSEEYGYILNDIDLKKEVWKLKEELEEIKKKLYI